MVQLLLESSMYTKNTSGLGMEIMPSFGCLEKSCQRPSTNGSELAAVNLHRELKIMATYLTTHLLQQSEIIQSLWHPTTQSYLIFEAVKVVVTTDCIML